MNPEQWLSLKWNGGSTMSDRWLNQSKIIQVKYLTFCTWIGDDHIKSQTSLVASQVRLQQWARQIHTAGGLSIDVFSLISAEQIQSLIGAVTNVK